MPSIKLPKLVIGETEANLVRGLLLTRGHTLSSIARRLGVTPVAIWNVINGKSRSRRITKHLIRILNG